MKVEIERKFLIDPDQVRALPMAKVGYLRQGYLSRDPVVRVRTVNEDKGWLTIKGKGTLMRAEFEYEVPYDDAEEMLALCGWNVLYKNRYIVQFGQDRWEIDEFFGELRGLWLAEIELKDINQRFGRPAFLKREVTDDPRYANANLVQSRYPLV